MLISGDHRRARQSTIVNLGLNHSARVRNVCGYRHAATDISSMKKYQTTNKPNAKANSKLKVRSSHEADSSKRTTSCADAQYITRT